MPQYFSPATQSVVVTAVGPSPSTTKTTAYVNVSGSNPACTGYQATTCKASLPLTKSGTYALTFFAYDSPQKSASGPFVGRPLETNETSFKYSGAPSSTYTVSLDGIPAYFSISPNGNGMLQGSRSGLTLYGGSTQQLLVISLDRDGNPIIGPGSPVITFTAPNGGLNVTATGPSNPNAFVVQAPQTGGTSTGINPGSVELVATATPPKGSGAATVSTDVFLNITHSVVATIQNGELVEYFDGSSHPSVQTTGQQLQYLALDSKGNAFTIRNNNTSSSEIVEFFAQSTTELNHSSLGYTANYLVVDNNDSASFIEEQDQGPDGFITYVDTYPIGSNNQVGGAVPPVQDASGFALDAHGNFVISGDEPEPSGDPRPPFIYNSCVGDSPPGDYYGILTVDRFDTVYVVTGANGHIHEYCGTPSVNEITDVVNPTSLAVDVSRQLYAATSTGFNIYTAGHTTATTKVVTAAGVDAIAVFPGSINSI